MNIKEGIQSAFKNLSSSKMRTFLTMLGMIIGIGSVIMILSIGAGVQDSLVVLFDKLGKGTIQLDALRAEPEDYFILEDFEVIETLPGVKMALPMISFAGSVKMKRADEFNFTQIWGVTADYNKVVPVKMLKGRYISEKDDKGKQNVAVVEEAFAISRFGTNNVIGKTIVIEYDNQNFTFEIVGVKDDAYDVAGIPTGDMPLVVYLPYGTVATTMFDFGEKKARYAIVSTEDNANTNEIAAQIIKILEKKHRVKDLYSAEPLSRQMGQLNEQLGIVMAFISVVAGISLLVGGVGIMNIMLVTVQERTREIGIRKAL
ncbi:MAG TPA: hypothetical protein GX707_12270 [Epulopiscium sp.]|nr:hypothetical protein [Candidatus Epulonipiscium sp.]